MRGRSQKATEPKTPKESLNMSTIQKYLKDASSKSPGLEKKRTSTKEKKKELGKLKVDQSERSREELDLEGEPDSSIIEDQRKMALIPTKTQMLEMFEKLENLIKAEISNVRLDMGHLLRRVEEAEELTGKQAQEILDLKMQMKRMQIDHRDILCKLEEQENQSRRQNLRIRALPEKQGDDLVTKLKKIFNPILDRRLDEDLKIDRVHRVRKPPGLREEIPRDVIIKFHLYEDKARIWSKLRGVSPVKFESVELQIFSD